MVAKIELSSPDIDRVTVHLDGTFVATMWAFDEENGIPVELFHLMRAAPDMLDVLRLIANADPSSGKRACNCEGMAQGFKCEDCLIWAAIDKAEGRAE